LQFSVSNTLGFPSRYTGRFCQQCPSYRNISTRIAARRSGFFLLSYWLKVHPRGFDTVTEEILKEPVNTVTYRGEVLSGRVNWIGYGKWKAVTGGICGSWPLGNCDNYFLSLSVSLSRSVLKLFHLSAPSVSTK
jgi:hypothetical protein